MKEYLPNISIQCKDIHCQGLAVLDLTPEPDNDLVWYMNRINVPVHFRRRGTGTELMEILCRLADSKGATVYVHPTTNYGSDIHRLREFFERFGFVSGKHLTSEYGGPEAYTRLPQLCNEV